MFKITLLILSVVATATYAFPSSDFDQYIVNGTDADILRYPYVCSLRVNNNHNCGASILNQNFLLTAAHCSGTTVECGAQTISPSGPNVYQVKNLIKHEEHSSATHLNDIAIIELATPLEYGPTIQPVLLPTPFYEVAGNWDSAATLVGYGMNESWGFIQTRLQEVELYVPSNEECNSRHIFRIYDSNICAGVPEGGKGQCSGDSGGPLTEHYSGYQVGIVSWSEKPCAIAPFPGVFTKVSHHCDWIFAKSGVSCS